MPKIKQRARISYAWKIIHHSTNKMRLNLIYSHYNLIRSIYFRSYRAAEREREIYCFLAILHTVVCRLAVVAGRCLAIPSKTVGTQQAYLFMVRTAALRFAYVYTGARILLSHSTYILLLLLLLHFLAAFWLFTIYHIFFLLLLLLLSIAVNSARFYYVN